MSEDQKPGSFPTRTHTGIRGEHNIYIDSYYLPRVEICGSGMPAGTGGDPNLHPGAAHISLPALATSNLH